MYAPGVENFWAETRGWLVLAAVVLAVCGLLLWAGSTAPRGHPENIDPPPCDANVAQPGLVC